MLAETNFIFHALRPINSYISFHQHNCYELVYYQSGKGLTRLGEVDYHYEANSYMIIPPDWLHDERRTEDTNVIFVGFSLNERTFPYLQEGIFQDESSSRILPLLLQMTTEMRDKQAYYTSKLNLLMSEIIVEHLRSHTINPVNDNNLLYIRKFIDENYSQKMTVEEMADIVGYSYHHFRHLFKNYFGVSPMQYVINKRLDKARRLLRYTELPISTITLECGFSNIAQFCTMFKREIGETPKGYRNSTNGNTLNRLN
ncbi:AraC family transcriptional regulator [Paenibacillus psychroresistens]|uniref:AraC family transcriptional regulator n=1 Tax=Paenibacillus psychroresistens TaxID=1778678 RepID=A0A6B8RIQ1_9BACL|nr:AraC family transcriptional regulator [Paenibacillus psychroresistens]QGQ95228.1 AraC family transcriptional regulator [Paenibacillus psychroresistens]